MPLASSEGVQFSIRKRWPGDVDLVLKASNRRSCSVLAPEIVRFGVS
jgi:hypothetical protein